jgi:hypothetical protein
MTIQKKRTLFQIAACGVIFAALTGNAHAANWLMLQGTEKPNAAERAYLWGFIQPQYSRTDGTRLDPTTPFGGQMAVFNTIAPDLDSDSQFQIQRARLGVRGQPFPLNAKINYFFLTEFGNNGITRGDGAQITDASVTLNYIAGVRIRAGQFKYPGAEEGLQAIHVFDYINFTSVTDQLLLERFLDRDGTPACTAAAGGTSETCANSPNGPVNAFRDVGVQLFDAFRFGAFEASYAFMIGNGNGITRGDNDGNEDTYYYLAGEWVMGGEGPRREGLKGFIWHQDGTRNLITGGTGAQNGAGGTAGTLSEFDRTRSGLGFTFRKSVYRAAAEYIVADGMILDGTDGGAIAGSANNAGTAFATTNIAGNDEADGYYLDVGFQPLRDRLELDLRYDILNRRTDTAAGEREFETITAGVQWFFDAKTRLTLNYEFRDAEAPGLPDTDNANKVLDGFDDRFALQITTIF